MRIGLQKNLWYYLCYEPVHKIEDTWQACFGTSDVLKRQSVKETLQG
jgi:hypothetical protein